MLHTTNNFKISRCPLKTKDLEKLCTRKTHVTLFHLESYLRLLQKAELETRVCVQVDIFIVFILFCFY